MKTKLLIIRALLLFAIIPTWIFSCPEIGGIFLLVFLFSLLITPKKRYFIKEDAYEGLDYLDIFDEINNKDYFYVYNADGTYHQVSYSFLRIHLDNGNIVHDGKKFLFTKSVL